MKTDLLKIAAGQKPEAPKAYIFELINDEPTLTHVYNVNVNPLTMLHCVIDSDDRKQAQTFLKFGVESLRKLAGVNFGKIEFSYSVAEAKSLIELINAIGRQPLTLGENLLSK